MAVSREQVVQTAEKYVSRGKIEPAIREYKKLLAENPNDINTLNRVGDLYARIQRIDEAVDFFTQIAEQYSTEGFFVKAIAIYKKIIKLNPTRLEVYEKLAELYHKQGLVNEARTQYQVLADYYQKHDNAASAIAIYQKMVDLEPENPSYHVKLAEIYHQQQLIEKALGEYRIIAEMMISHGRAQEAAQVFERGLDLDSGNVAFVTDAVLKLRESGHGALAARFLAVAMERNPKAEQVARLTRAEDVEAVPAAVEIEAEAEMEIEVEAEMELEAERETAPGLGRAELELPSDLFDSVPLSRPVEEAPEERPERGTFSGVLEEGPDFGALEASTAPAESEEIELDLEEVFVLDIEDDEEPTSLVKPPPDMGSVGRAWVQEGEEEEEEAPVAAAAAEPAPEPDVPRGWVELPTLEDGGIDLGEGFFEVEVEEEPAVAAAAPGEAEAEVELLSLEEPSWAIELEDEAPAEFVVDAVDAIDPAPLESAADEVEPKAAVERAEDLISEAEVLAKYGLEEKALERLREALKIKPQSLDAYALMVQIHLDKGRAPRAVELAGQMAAVAAEAGDRQIWPKTRKLLLEAGLRIEGERSAEPSAPRRRPEGGLDQMLRGLLDGGQPAARKPSAPPAAPAPAPPAVAQAAAPAPPAPAPAPPSAQGKSMIFNPLEIGEMIEREEMDWDDEPREPSPPLRPASPAAGASVAPASALDDTGMSWLDEADNGRPDSVGASSGLFDDEADFFDLAAELEQELSQEDVFRAGDDLLVQPSEQSLEEIVEGFKKGVAEHLSPTDYDTHFNLGIAYREMGLLDEAIGEFQLASKDPRHLVLCCSMLGLCFLDKGLPELAVKWYRRGLEAPGIGEEDTLGLLYDLGCVYLTLGDEPTAYKTFVELYGINTNYRDVVARIEELGHR